MSNKRSMIGQISDKSLTIHVQHGTEVTEVETNGSSTILSVQKKIQEMWGIPVEHQHLHWNILIKKQTNSRETVYALKKLSSDVEVITPSDFYPSQDIQRRLKETKLEIRTAAKQSNRKNDAVLMNEMVLAAKAHNFSRAFDILEGKNYLLNGIPVERHWSALHQAVFSSDVTIVKRFLNFDNCDVHVRALLDGAGITKHRENPAQLAKMLELHDIQSAILAKGKHILAESPVFVGLAVGAKYVEHGLPLFWMSSGFMPTEMVHSLNDLHCTSFLSLTEHFYASGSKDFQRVRDYLANTLYLYSADLCKLLLTASTVDALETCLIEIFSNSHVYANVNKALRRAIEHATPTEADLLLSLYVFVMESTLLHSEKFRRYQGISYYGCNLTADEIAPYQIGVSFMWASFTSSFKSASASFKGNVKFVIDNRCDSRWSPREVDEVADRKVELEVLHPAGAKFQVLETSTQNENIEIKVRLMD